MISFQNVERHNDHVLLLIFVLCTLQGKSLNSVLYDAWASCSEGSWSKSQFLMQIRHRHLSKKRGCRKWLTAREMNSIFGEDLAQQIRDRKLFDTELFEKEVRCHPELPESEAGDFYSLINGTQKSNQLVFKFYYKQKIKIPELFMWCVWFV